MSEAQISDPGTGTKGARVGTVEWALRVRLSMQFLVNHIHVDPESLAQYHTQCIKHRAWTMMHKKDGTTFASFEEFCETPQPWGLGRKWSELEPYVSAAIGKQAVQLATVAPAQPGPGRGKKKDADRPSFDSTSKDKALRAILRAPVEVQDLYREGLISQSVAAKLGPKVPALTEKTPKAKRSAIEKKIQARADLQGRALVALGEVPREKKAIDAAMREVLGVRPPSRVEQAAKLVALMSPAELRKFFEAVEQYRRSL